MWRPGSAVRRAASGRRAWDSGGRLRLNSVRPWTWAGDEGVRDLDAVRRAETLPIATGLPTHALIDLHAVQDPEEVPDDELSLRKAGGLVGRHRGE